MIHPDGTETVYTQNAGSYTPPVAVYDTLTQNPDGSFTLTAKGGTVFAFRASEGMLASITDTNGNTITLAYSGSYLTTVTDSTGRSITLGYTAGQLASVSDCQGRTWSIAYDAQNLPTAVYDPAINGQNPSRVLGYDLSGNVNQITDRLGRTWQYVYDASNNLQGVTDPANNVSQPNYRPSSFGKLSGASPGILGTVTKVAWTDAQGSTTTWTLDTQGRVTGVQNPLGNTTSHSCDSANNRISTTTPLGHVWQFTWDGQGNNLVTQDPLGSQSSRTYGVFGRVTSATDASGNTTRYATTLWAI